MAEKKETRRGLGRGLSALMADVDTTTSAVSDTDAPRPDRKVPIEQVHPNPDQPRRTFTDEQMEDLANSIKTKGVIQPLIVRPHPQKQGQFEIVAGERRWRASQMAQLHEVPVLIRNFDDTEVLEVAIIENIQRADLNAIEEAMGYKQLMMKFGHTQEKLAEALGKSRSHIANLMRLLNLPDSVQTMVTEGQLSAGHARTLVTAAQPERLADTIVKKGLSVRDAEKLVKKTTEGVAPRQSKTSSGTIEKDADTRALEGDLSAALGMKVKIDHVPGKEKGRLVIDYDTLEQLDALCGLLSTYR